MTDFVDYALASLRRAADNAYPWTLTPTEAGALIAEVERLRARIAELEERVAMQNEHGLRAEAQYRSREAWFVHIAEDEQHGRLDDREAVIAYLHALGLTEAAAVIADAGYPLALTLPPVTRATMTGSGGTDP